ncbi:MAG: UbiX family flavin prenyltransferase, partial [Rikenellaceae bacterium]|nr:UbiX family flavin prenyltransferase [Rikenellaceae bacterium]
MKIIVGVTGASGTIYARRLLERVIPSSAVSEIALIVTDNGKAVAEYEGEAFPASDKIRIADNHSMFDATASGSADYDAMVVIPCSMGTLGRIASGVSTDLMCRAADVMLKERRRLILCTRETPLSLIHIKNMS